jgi:hypothetical protein
MNTRYQSQPVMGKWCGKCIIALFVLSFLLAGCAPATPAPTSPPQFAPTAISASAQPTLAPTQTAAPKPTSTLTATLPPTQTPSPSPTSTPTTAPTPTPLPVILLTDWRVGNFIEIPEGCLFEQTNCWQTVVSEARLKLNGKTGGHNHGATKRPFSQSSQSSLTSRSSLLVDPAWNNPYLVYWYDNQINGDIYIAAKVDEEAQAAMWETLANHSFTGQSLVNKNWKIDTLDLTKYRGQKIFISFNADIILPPSQNGHLPGAINKWHLQKILILPDYHPGMEKELSSAASARTAETSPAISSTNTLTGTSSTGPIQLTDWSTFNLSVLSTGCKFPDQICWRSETQTQYRAVGHKNQAVVQAETGLISKTSVFIDPGWNNPRLVFWVDDPFPGDLSVLTKADLNWIMLAHFPLTGQGAEDWRSVSVDLSPFKGKTILLNIAATLKIPRTALQNNSSTGANRWHIQNIQLIPNFTGTP